MPALVPCMPALVLRFEEPTFREGIANYVTAMCRKYHVPRQDVNDLIQEALTKIIANIGTYHAEEGDFDKWARTVAVNVIHRYLRQAKRFLDRFSEYYPNVDDYAAPEPSPERCARRTQAKCELTIAAENLSPRQVDVVDLHVLDGVPHREIAQRLKTTEGAIQKCYQRARDRMAECLSGKTFSIMPAEITGCYESISFNESGSFNEIGARLTKWSHYSGQITAGVIAFLLSVPVGLAPRMHDAMTGEVRDLGSVQNDVMYRYDEPAVHRDTPCVKPEPASLPSVRDVATTTTVVDKPKYVQELAPLPPHKHDPSSADHHLFGR